MVHANELRINNWHVLGSQYFQLTEKGFMEVTVFDTVDRLFPITLTPEILEKCGFKKDRGFLSSAGEQWLLELPVLGANKNEIYFFCSGENSFGRASVNGDHASNNFFYLHQLQNIYFALTGEELTVNL